MNATKKWHDGLVGLVVDEFAILGLVASQVASSTFKPSSFVSQRVGPPFSPPIETEGRTSSSPHEFCSSEVSKPHSPLYYHIRSQCQNILIIACSMYDSRSRIRTSLSIEQSYTLKTFGHNNLRVLVLVSDYYSAKTESN